MIEESEAGNEKTKTTNSEETDTVRSHYSGRSAGNHFVYAGYLVQRKEQRASNRRTGSSADAAELGKHFDTAIDAMTMLLAGFKEESEVQNEE